MATKRAVVAQPRYKLAESGELNQTHPETGYAPHLTCSARCMECPLGPNKAARLPELNVDAEGRQRRLWEPVKTHNEGKEIYLLGPAPSTSEAESGLPMDGAAGWRLNLGLTAALNSLHAEEPGFKKVVPDTVRRHVASGYVVACQGPGVPTGAFERMRATLQRENSRRKKLGLPVVPDPVDCCRPRLLAEIAGSQKIILLGTEALQAVLRGSLDPEKGGAMPRESLTISNKRGAMGEVVVSTEEQQERYAEIGRVVPKRVPLRWAATFHPFATIASPGKLPKFKADISKFFRFFEGKLKWVEPAVLMHPMIDRIKLFFDAIEREAESSNIEAPTCRIEIDTETTGKEALIAQMRCIGIGRGLTSAIQVEACVCEPHWNLRLDAQRVQWLGKDKRFRGGVCPICGRGGLDSDADIERSAPGFLAASLGADLDSQGELETETSQELWSEACQSAGLDLDPLPLPLPSPWSEARAQDCMGESATELELSPISLPPPRSSDYEVLLLLSPFAAPWLYAGDEASKIWAYLSSRVECILSDKRILKVGHNCLFTGTPVILGNGDSVAIEQLVRMKYSGTVKALNKAGEVVEAQVTDWFQQRVPGQEWMVIRRVGEKGGARGLTLTPEHEVYTTRGRVEARDVKPGDQILVEERQFEPDELAALLGTLIGDSVAYSTTSKSSGVPGKNPVPVRVAMVDATAAALKGSHNSDLTHDKNKWLAGLFTVESNVQVGGFSVGNTTLYYRTSKLRQVAELAKMVYREDGKRHLSVEILDALGPVGLSWFYADDGFKHKRENRKREAMLIAVCRYSDEEIEIVRSWFESKFGSVTLTLNRCLRLSIEASQVFAEHIAPYLLPSARHKLPVGTWPDFVGFKDRVYRPLPVVVESVASYEPPRTRSEVDTRWCLQTMEGNFLTGFGFVSNCGHYDRQIIEPSPWRNWHVVGSKEEGVSGIKWERRRVEKAWIEVTPEPVEDTLYATRFSCPDGEKGLGDVGPEKVDVTSWKTDHADNKVTLSKNLWELGVYCGSDVCVNGRIYPILKQEAVDNGALLGYIPAVSGLLSLPGETYRGTQPSSEAEIAAFVKGGRKVEYSSSTQISPYEVDHRTQFMSVGAHRVGLYVSQDRVRVFSSILHSQGREHLRIFADIAKSKYGVELAPKPADDRADSELTKKELRERRRREEKGQEDDNGDLNPNSANQMRDLFYTRMKIPRPEFLEEKEMLTKTGAPRVDDVVIRAFMADPRNSKEIKQALGHLRAGKRKEFKLATGFLDTLARPLADPGQIWPGSPRGYLWPDGCIRAHMNTHSNVNWRLNISGPNFAQIGSRKGGILQEIGEGSTRLDELLRDADEATRAFLVSEMFRLMKQEEKAGKQYLSGKLKSVLGAYPGYLLVGGDMDQLHLRIIANLYKIPILLNAFLAGEDPHTTLAEVLFGNKFRGDPSWVKVGGYSRKKKPPSGSGALILREVAKTFRYAVIYWAHPDTAWRVVVSAENEFGALVNAHYTKDEIRQFHAAWRVAEPEWDSFYWARMRKDHAAHQGRVQAPLSWRFSPFIADNDKSKIVNDPVLSTEADIARIAEVRLMQTFPFGGDSCVSPQSFGGLPGQLLGLLGKYDLGSVLREGLCIQVHDFMAAQIKDKTGSRGSIWIPKKNKEGESVQVEVDRWQHETLMLAQEALTFKVPGQDVVYSCEPGLSAILSEV